MRILLIAHFAGIFAAAHRVLKYRLGQKNVKNLLQVPPTLTQGEDTTSATCDI
jgi:hypothetical protein